MIHARSVFKFGCVNKHVIRNASVATAVSAPDEVSQRKPWKEIPGPSTLPVVGQLHHFLPGGSLFNKRGHEFYDHLYTQYGPVVRLSAVLKPDLLILYDAEGISKILQSENWMPMRPAFFSLEYFKRYHNKSKEQSLKAAGLSIDQGENWKQFRSKVNPAMLIPNTVKLYREAVTEVAHDTIVRWRRLRDNNNMIDGQFDKEMNLWSLESIGVVALGCRINCLDNVAGDPKVDRLIECTHQLLSIADDLDFKPSIWKYYPTKTFKRAMKVYEDIEIITKHYIDMALDKFKSKTTADSEKCILEKLMDIDKEVAHIMACDMLIAGIDTTSNTITATLYLLATNPRKQDKLREELKSSRNRKYLKACLKESMRMMPVVGLNMRQVTKKYNILGYEIPKDMNVLFCHQYLSMMEAHYPKPQDYIPERWTVDATDPMCHSNAHPYAHLPFGFGSRTCIGRRIAELEMEVFLESIIQNFQIEWRGPPPEIYSTHINYVKGPYNFVFNDV